jgi:hypothetical protein
VLTPLRLDADDEVGVQRLLGYRAGRCYARDFDGRMASIQVRPAGGILE